MQIFMGKKKNKKCKTKPQKHPKTNRKNRCQAICCGSRLSISSVSSCSEANGWSDKEQTNKLSNLAHGVVQSRLNCIIDENVNQLGFHRRQRSDRLSNETIKPVCNINDNYNNSRRCVVLIAMEQDSHDPREDFRRSILEVITCNGLIEPKELRGLLNCYVSMNSCEHRQVILETFIEVCSALFVGQRGLKG